MHRLISARNLYQSNIHGITLPSNNTLQTLSPVSRCSFCRKVFLTEHYTVPGNVFVRNQSTRTAKALKSVKKKSRYKSYKKYGEVMEVNESSMMETKVSISKLHAKHLSKLASSPVSLGQLHQLTTILPKKSINEVDPELLRSVKEKILKKKSSSNSTVIDLEDDKCALIFTSHKISALQDQFRTKQYVDRVKESYYSFRKATLYDQRLQDLRYAISEGVTQEFDLDVNDTKGGDSLQELPKSPHAVFRELFINNNHLDSYDQELFSHLSSLHYQDMPHPALEDICDDTIHTEVERKEDFDRKVKKQLLKTLKVKKEQQLMNQKKKKQREKRRAAQELSVKQGIKDLDRLSKQDALNRLLGAHLQVLCTLDMVTEGCQVLQHYRHKSIRGDQPNVSDVRLYNTLIHGYAFKGNLEETMELMRFMAEDGVETNPQTYAALFECVERSSIKDKISVLNYHKEDMQKKGIKLNDLMDQSKFQYDQQEVVLRAIRRLEPDFVPDYTPPHLDYDCPLLDDLKLDNIENRIGLFTSPAENLLSLEELKEKGRQQLEMEINGEIEVENITLTSQKEIPSVNKYREKLQCTETEWRGVIREAFTRNLSTLRSRSIASHNAISLYPYLKVLEPDQFVELIMGEIRKLIDGSESYSPTLKLLQRDLGTQIYQKYQIKQRRRNGVLAKISQVYDEYCEWYLTRGPLDHTGRAYNSRQAWQLLLHRNREGASLDFEENPWPTEIRQNIGKFLYNIIINDVKIDVNMFKSKAKPKKLPAVYRVHRPWGRLVRLELKPHPTLARLWGAAAAPALRMRTALAPTLSPPAPWRSAAAGAYLLTETPLIRMPIYVMSQSKLLEEAPQGSLHPVLDSLNQLGEVPWRINTPILDLQLQVFRSGGDKKLDIPPPASSLDTCSFGAGAADGAAGALKRRLAINRARADMHSLWCDSLYKLSLANHYRERMFWLPHNMDFRGRVYAVGPHVSVLGADAARALLMLARREPLGPRGLRWLKLHAVNLTGTMKRCTIEERYEYAESIMDKILDSADRPLNGEGWWKQSEEPWQTLACCMEIAKAVRSPNPEAYMCGFPVHQDGSCNGLQHYAALGRDAPGAAAVNLAPRPRPQDVYTDVAALVEAQRARDAAAGVAAAITLEGFVRRKVIKQTVMTTVYGVTRFGARLQIAKQLKDIEEFPKEHVWTCSHYLTAKTFDSLREMFTSTKLIQDWFTDCAKMIAGVCGESVQWRTPLGLPVLQPYYRRAQRPCTMKQRNAFPPNFIHSLDSSHMMLTSLRCQAAGVTFVSVHDCFWTHPHSVDRMNEICREQFVALHSQPILENLSDFLFKQYSYPESEVEEFAASGASKRRVNELLRAVPPTGDFDIHSVLRSLYFFS